MDKKTFDGHATISRIEKISWILVAPAILVVLLTFSMLVPQVTPWAGSTPVTAHHKAMTEDTLSEFPWPAGWIENIAEWANEVDDLLPHCAGACHRVTKYQRLFETYGGDICNMSGAEEAAAFFIGMAYQSYHEGNIADFQRHLGFAIHFIQDAVCPPHVFPFQQGVGKAHTNFEAWTNTMYSTPAKYWLWRSQVLNAPAFEIEEPYDLQSKIEDAAELVFKLSCSYIAQNGAEIIDPDLGPTGLSGWIMKDADIGFSMGIAASIAKGAAIWATEGIWPADVGITKHGSNYVRPGGQVTYSLHYFNLEGGVAYDVVLTDALSPDMTFMSASHDGDYDPATHRVTWNIGTLDGFSWGEWIRLTVSVPHTVTIGTVLENTATIKTTSQEYSTSDNHDEAFTTVTTGGLPVNVDVSPVLGYSPSGPIVWSTSIVTFTYHGDASVLGVEIRIHLDDGGPEISGSMEPIPGTHDWSFSHVFDPRWGFGTVIYTVLYAGGQEEIGHGIVIRSPRLVDPSGYIFDSLTGDRISDAPVTLFRFDIVSHQFVVVAPDDPEFDPPVNPQFSDAIGEYGWMVSPGIYMVLAECDGYIPNAEIVTVPPPATEVNIALTPIEIPPVVATLDTNPDTLNLRSEGRWITSYIELADDYNPRDIDISTVRLNAEIPAELHLAEIGDNDEDGILDLMVKFNRAQVVALLGVGEATLTITGEVDDKPFEGSDTIRVIGG